MRSDDRGSALIAVLALAGVTAVIAVTVGSASVSSLQFSNNVSAGLEARAAAQAGIVRAELALRTPTGCSDASGTFTSTTTPKYKVTTYHDTGSGVWALGCPTIQAVRVRFLATGDANRATFAGSSASGGRAMEAVYQYVPQPTPLTVIAPAVYAYQITGELKNFNLGVQPNTTIASDIQIRTGNFICTNGASVAGSVVLGNGYAEITNCRISRDLYVSDYVRASGSDSIISGNLIAAGRVLDAASTAVTLSSRAAVSTDVWAGGSVRINGSGRTLVGGNVTAALNRFTVVALEGGTRINGNTLTTGLATGRPADFGSKPQQSYPTTGPGSISPPPAPLVPNWTDLPFSSSQPIPSSWVAAGFTNVVTWSGDCNLSGSDPRWGALSGYISKTIIDATACVGGVVVSGNLSPDVSLKTDVVFFSNSFSFMKLPAQASNATDPRRLYFIVPDNTSTPAFQPTCANGAGNITYNNETNINAPLALFFYSPCSVISERNNMRGQIYGGSVEFRQQAQWTYVPSQPPGVNFNPGGAVQQVQSGAALGQRLSIRELSSGD